jgi:hypothetical protein
VKISYFFRREIIFITPRQQKSSRDFQSSANFYCQFGVVLLLLHQPTQSKVLKHYFYITRMFLSASRIISGKTVLWSLPSRSFKFSAPRFGIKDFFDPEPVGDEVMSTGRGWTVPDLRRKVACLIIIIFEFYFKCL